MDELAPLLRVGRASGFRTKAQNFAILSGMMLKMFASQHPYPHTSTSLSPDSSVQDLIKPSRFSFLGLNLLFMGRDDPERREKSDEFQMRWETTRAPVQLLDLIPKTVWIAANFLDGNRVKLEIESDAGHAPQKRVCLVLPCRRRTA